MASDMKIKSIRCPNCDSSVFVYEKGGLCTCKYCGSQLRVEPTNEFGMSPYESPFKIEIVKRGAKVLRFESELSL